MLLASGAMLMAPLFVISSMPAPTGPMTAVVADHELHKDTCGSTVVQAADATTNTPTAPAGDNALTVARAFAAAGFSKASTAGVLGNLEHESGIRPDATEPRPGGGYGIAQWTPRAKLQARMDANHITGSDSSLDVQTKVLIATATADFNNVYHDAAASIVTVKDTLVDTWLTAPDARTAAVAWVAGWERPADITGQAVVRADSAERYYQALDGIDFTTPDGQAPPNMDEAPDRGDTGSKDGTPDATSASCTSNGSRVENYVRWALDTALDPNVGYSTTHRRLDPDVDCSSFIFYALVKGGGFDGGDNPFNTTTMSDQLEQWGFRRITGKTVQRGDILVNPAAGDKGHAEIATSPTRSVGAHSDNGHPEHGDQTGGEVSENDLWPGFTEAYRPPADTTSNAAIGKVGGAPDSYPDFSWLCNTGLHVCHAGDFGVPMIAWSGDYQCYWYWLAREWVLHDGDITNPMTATGGQLANHYRGDPAWTVSDSPKPGAGVSFESQQASFYETHVAVVEEVDSDPSGWRIKISEGNWNNGGTGSWANGYGTRWLTRDQANGHGLQGFFWKNSWNM